MAVWVAQVSGGLLTDTFVAWFAILGGAAGFVSLAITLARLRTSALAKPSQSETVAPPAVSPAAASSPAPALKLVAPPAPAIDESIPGEVMALISAAVAVTLGKHARIAAVMPVPVPPVELLQQWSIEGRRQIYSSHQIR